MPNRSKMPPNIFANVPTASAELTAQQDTELFRATPETRTLYETVRSFAPAKLVIKIAELEREVDCAALMVAHRARFPEEADLVSRAVPKRVLECLGARNLARMALADLGAPQVAIGCGTMREPLWPEGIVGSIAHSNRLLMVAVGINTDFRAVGVDIEPNQPLPPDVESHVCLPGEDNLVPQSRALFVVKEAFYKAHFGIHRRFLDFPAVRVHWTDRRVRDTQSATTRTDEIDRAPNAPTNGPAHGSTSVVCTRLWTATELAPPPNSIGPTTLSGSLAVTDPWLAALSAIEA